MWHLGKEEVAFKVLSQRIKVIKSAKFLKSVKFLFSISAFIYGDKCFPIKDSSIMYVKFISLIKCHISTLYYVTIYVTEIHELGTLTWYNFQQVVSMYCILYYVSMMMIKCKSMAKILLA